MPSPPESATSGGANITITWRAISPCTSHCDVAHEGSVQLRTLNRDQSRCAGFSAGLRFWCIAPAVPSWQQPSPPVAELLSARRFLVRSGRAAL